MCSSDLANQAVQADQGLQNAHTLCQHQLKGSQAGSLLSIQLGTSAAGGHAAGEEQETSVGQQRGEHQDQ